MGLRGRSVWVCAGAPAAGAAIARSLAEAGARVLLHSAPEQALAAEQAIEALVRSGGAVEIVAGDLHSREQIERTVEDLWRTAGSLYGLVVQPPAAPPRRFEDLDQAAWHTALDTWLRTPFFLAQCVAPRMASAGGGRIVHVVATGRPATASITDRATRRGLLTMTTGLAKAVGPLVRVSAVVESDDVAFGGQRITAEQLAAAVRFLLDDASGGGGAAFLHLDARSAP